MATVKQCKKSVKQKNSYFRQLAVDKWQSRRSGCQKIDRLAADVERFLSNGGSVSVIEHRCAPSRPILF